MVVWMAVGCGGGGGVGGLQGMGGRGQSAVGSREAGRAGGSAVRPARVRGGGQAVGGGRANGLQAITLPVAWALRHHPTSAAMSFSSLPPPPEACVSSHRLGLGRCLYEGRQGGDAAGGRHRHCIGMVAAHKRLQPRGST